MGLFDMNFTHDYKKVLFYLSILIITVLYILIFLNTLYMKLFLWKNSQLKHKHTKDKAIIEQGSTIIPMQEVFDYKLYLNSYESKYSENKCLSSKYNDIILTTNYNLYLKRLILITFYTCFILYITFIFITFCINFELKLPPFSQYIAEIFPHKEKNNIFIFIFILILIPFIFIFTNNNLKNNYKLSNNDVNNNFENYMYMQIRELISDEKKNTQPSADRRILTWPPASAPPAPRRSAPDPDSKCFTDLKKFFENINKNNIQNYVDFNSKTLTSFARETFAKYDHNPKVYTICKKYIILCYELSKINKYTNVDVVKNMRDFLYLCEKAYDENNSMGYKFDDTNVKLNIDDNTIIEKLFDEIKKKYNVDIIIGTNNEELFTYFNDNKKKSIDNTKFDELIAEVNNITDPVSSSNYKTLICNIDNYFKYSLDVDPPEKKLEAEEIAAHIYDLDQNKKILFFNTTTFFKGEDTDDEFTKFKTYENDKNGKLLDILNSELGECYILSYEYKNNDFNDIDSFQCIFYKNISFVFNKNFDFFISKIFTGNFIYDNDLKTSNNNDYNFNNIFFISMLTKNLFNKNPADDDDGSYYFHLKKCVKNYYIKKLADNYGNFDLYIITYGIVFGIFTIIFSYITLHFYYKDFIYDINNYLLNTKINKGRDYIINLYTSFALSIFSSRDYVPSFMLIITFIIFIILLFILPYPYNIIAIFIMYILPYLIVRFHISSSIITATIILIILIATLTKFINFQKNYAISDNTLSDIISKIVIFTLLTVAIVILMYVYLNFDIGSIYKIMRGDYSSFHSFMYVFILFFIAIMSLAFFIVNILFYGNYLF
jgi:hypothetical protein